MVKRVKAMDPYSFDTILFPVNFVLFSQANFGPQVLAKAQEKSMGIFAIKAMAKTSWPADLGTLGGTYSEAAAIDVFGQVVGLAYTSGNSEQHAFLYNNGAMHDLNTLIAPGSGCNLAAAVGINNAGQIAANGNCSRQQHAVLLPLFIKHSCSLPSTLMVVAFSRLKDEWFR